ncbi:MAG: hypothetical protein H6867_06835 [Rhodospirillales bacterium]|nr:hypothetical protein [Rhodospirillales bacterium]MCB9995265.1 hypothetical protein [Rhodospirillales bacterium]
MGLRLGQSKAVNGHIDYRELPPAQRHEDLADQQLAVIFNRPLFLGGRWHTHCFLTYTFDVHAGLDKEFPGTQEGHRFHVGQTVSGYVAPFMSGANRGELMFTALFDGHEDSFEPVKRGQPAQVIDFASRTTKIQL